MLRARSTRLTLALVTLALALLLAAACSGGSKTGGSGARATTTTSHPRATTPIRAPAGDLYRPPARLRPAKPGTIIYAQLFAQRVTDPTIKPASTIWLMLYHSRDRTGHDVAVSGFALVPNDPPPAGGRPVYAWAHGLAGLGDSCAPSKAIRDNLPPYGGRQLERGAVVVATDYPGLGTPGNHPYLVGVSEGRAVLDSIRAAASLPNVGSIGDVVIAGRSEGGGAALWAAQLARAYAPELHVRGVVALAPAAELPTIAASVIKTPSFLGVTLLAADGLRAGYPDFDPSSFLTPAAEADLARVDRECANTTIARYRTRTPKSVVRRNPDDVPAVHTVLVANSPGATDPHVPILLVQGANDEQIPVRVTAQLHTKYCALHATVERVVYPRTSHDGIVDAAQNDVLQYIADRFAGKPARSDCT